MLSWRAKFPDFARRDFWIAGESYAGKYIPDLAMEIDLYNRNNPNATIPLKGMLIGNGVMDFRDEGLERSRIDYVLQHEFAPPDLEHTYRVACTTDAQSAGCNYFKHRLGTLMDKLNPYNVYGYCYYNNTVASPSQSSTLLGLGAPSISANSAPCAFFDGISNYFNLNGESFHAAANGWKGPCNENVSKEYKVTPAGSMEELIYLVNWGKYKTVLYNGDWDAVVPYVDTLKNIGKLYVATVGNYTPWFVEGQHAGFYQNYTMNLRYVTIKGASHQAPQSKRAAAYQLFSSTVMQ